ncbi:T-complex protein 1 subunit zeta [Pancytospora philotis]|nr:T-complex protein 1 subunit zeta [Pancytospora philotis]
MQSTSSEAQVTQTGQAIAINNVTCKQLYELFATMLGPDGAVKALVNGGQQLNITKDGHTLCREVPFTHPTSILITRGANSVYASAGDGTISFILLCCDTFAEAYKHYCEGTTVPLIVNSLQLALKDSLDFVKRSAVPLSDELLRGLALSSLQTKIRRPEWLVDIVMKALVGVTASGKFDVDMVEVIKMEGGDIRDSVYVDGLVLDHSGRHHAMPTQLENVRIMISNMSLEYEKPEINAEFCYSSAAQRDAMAASEREFILERARAIAAYARELRQQGKSLVLVNEKGIDPYSLEILSDAGVLALRRAKRRNLERLVNMCGGKIITQLSQLAPDCLGSCARVSVKDFGENKYTFIEGTAFKGACTILIRGGHDYERLHKSIRGTLFSLFVAVQSRCCIRGGTLLYRQLVGEMERQAGACNAADIVGYKVLGAVYENIIKTLLRNRGENLTEGLARLFRGESECEAVIENVQVVGNALNNAVVTAINLLMCDEIIKAGKAIKDDKLGS